MTYRNVLLALIAGAVTSAGPAHAGNAQILAWELVQKVNEMAVETRKSCFPHACPEAAAVSGMSFSLLRHAKRCDSGRYPSSCRALDDFSVEIEKLYAVYTGKVGPESVAENRAAVAAMACAHVPMTGTCGTHEGVVQAQMAPSPN